ncbi:MAG: 2-oxoacid:acceptor oxidoreductase family protein [Sporomusa sp.]
MRHEIRLAGFGGQGIISIGIILANAAGKYQGRQVAQTQSYGPEARGGACKTEVVISDTEIDFIKAVKPDILVAMSQPALDKYIKDIDCEKTLLIIDSTLITAVPSQIINVKGIPATQIAEEELNTKVVANVIMLGALIKLSELIPAQSCLQAIRDAMPPKMVELNITAFNAGFNYAESL